ncbi:MAG: nuclear transport factor 2 family protein [Gammaproteobacteria bacterium]|nr:nuclear transport factor 2 family protein [Gammaproteobacteria bacterium]MCP5139189.1 nuclear transport factor 2 family protein [Chromatiales bacterium]
MTAAPQTALERELSEFLDRYAALYNRQAYAELLEMWDTGDPDSFYMAEEVDPPMYGWQAIRAYFDRPGSLDGIRNEYSEVRARHLAPDLALATYKLRFDIAVKDMKPLSSFDRVVAVFRRRDGEWKLAAYAEAPQAPLTMVRKLARNSKSLGPAEQQALLQTVKSLLEDTVPADFEQWLKAQA